MAVEYDISSDVAVIKETGSVSQCARVTQMYSGQITYDDEAGSKFATATINGKSQRVMLCIAVSGTVTYDDVPSLYSTVDGHRCLNIVTPTETGTPDDVPSLYETVVIDGQNVRAVRCIMINKTPVYDGVSSVCTFTGDDGKTHTAQLVNKVTGGSTVVIIKGTSPLNLPDAIANSLQYVKAFGGTEQNGTPTPDTPVDIVSNNGVLKYSANMANVNAQTALVGYYISAQGSILASASNWMYQDFIPVKPNTTYTLSFSEGLYFVSISEYIADNDSGFVRRNAKQSSTSSAPFNVTFITITTGATTNYIRFGSNMYSSQNLTLADVLAVNWMLNVGNSMPYTPYGIYTDGTVETINAHGKNLFGDVNAESGYLDSNGDIVSDSGWLYTANYIPVKPSTTYAFTPNSTPGGFPKHIYYDKNKAIISTIASGPKIFTTPSNCAFMRFSYRNSSFDIQLEQGNTATDYAPYYDGGTATAEMLLKVGDYQDVQSILDGAVTRNVGVKVFDGTENWKIGQTFYLENAFEFMRSANNTPYCTHYKGISGDTVAADYLNSNSVRLYNAQPLYRLNIFAVMSDYADVNAFKQYLADQYAAGTPVIIVYPLATSTTESVAGQTLQVTDGDNVLEITQAGMSGLELEAEYQAAVSLTIQEVQDANLDPNVEVTIS